MALRIARWFKGFWVMNPFDLTYEQADELSKIESLNIKTDEFSVKYFTHYSWGHVFEEESFDNDFHEIMVYYGCPSGYSRQKQIEWLKKHGYPFEVV